jgi:hypothetical protein
MRTLFLLLGWRRCGEALPVLLNPPASASCNPAGTTACRYLAAFKIHPLTDMQTVGSPGLVHAPVCKRTTRQYTTPASSAAANLSSSAARCSALRSLSSCLQGSRQQHASQTVSAPCRCKPAIGFGNNSEQCWQLTLAPCRL